MPVADGPTPVGKVRPKPLRPDLQMSPAAKRALMAADTPAQKQLFAHETDIGNVESIRRTGIRPSRGGAAMGHEGVYAYEGGAAGRTVPKGRAVIEFQADPRRISGRGTTPGSKSVALAGGAVGPEDIVGGYGPGGRLFNAAQGPAAIGSLLNALSGVLGGPSLLSPMDNVMMHTQQQLYKELGLDDVYAPGERWSEQVPVYGKGHGGGALRGRYRTIQHQTPTGTTLA